MDLCGLLRGTLAGVVLAGLALPVDAAPSTFVAHGVWANDVPLFGVVVGDEFTLTFGFDPGDWIWKEVHPHGGYTHHYNRALVWGEYGGYEYDTDFPPRLPGDDYYGLDVDVPGSTKFETLEVKPVMTQLDYDFQAG